MTKSSFSLIMIFLGLVSALGIVYGAGYGHGLFQGEVNELVRTVHRVESGVASLDGRVREVESEVRIDEKGSRFDQVERHLREQADEITSLRGLVAERSKAHAKPRRRSRADEAGRRRKKLSKDLPRRS